MSNNKAILERCIAGEYKICNSSLWIDDGKIYLLLSYKSPTKNHDLNKNLKAIAKLSFLAPIVVTINGNEENIGDKDSYLYKRIAIQNGLRRRQKSMQYNKGGKGIHKKIKGVDEFKKKESRSVDNIMHNISHSLIQHCIRNNAGILELTEIIQTFEDAKEYPFVIRNWSFGKLRDKIEYKCKINGIELIIT